MNQSKINENWPVVGNGHIVAFLSKIVAKNQGKAGGKNLDGAYIFTGPRGAGKKTTALYFAKLLLCRQRKTGQTITPCGICASCRLWSKGEEAGQSGFDFAHGDFFFTEREAGAKKIGIEQIRSLINWLAMTPMFGLAKVAIINEADDLSEEAANALLKTLEEPPAGSIVILVTAAPETLPPTIVSRSRVMRFYPVAAERIYDYLLQERGAGRKEAQVLSRLAVGSPALARKFKEEADFLASYAELAKSFVDFFDNNLPERFAAIEAIFGSGPRGKDWPELAARALEVWQSAARDVYLYKFGLADLARNVELDYRLKAIAQRIDLKSLLAIFQALDRAFDYIRGNVNAKNALESVACGL